MLIFGSSSSWRRKIAASPDEREDVVKIRVNPSPRILITSGGVKAPIDDVRWIGNRSTGRFGTAAAEAALLRGAHVTLLHATDALTPFQVMIALNGDLPAQFGACRLKARRLAEGKHRFRSFRFSGFSQYARRLERLLRTRAFDMVFLAAAVSDYATTPAAGKLASDCEELTLSLARLPKLIARVKDWAPDVFLVGFKLLSGATQETLLATAMQAGRVNRADVTVANDLQSLRQRRHTIHLVRAGEEHETYAADGVIQPAEMLIERTFLWWAEKNAK